MVEKEFQGSDASREENIESDMVLRQCPLCGFDWPEGNMIDEYCAECHQMTHFEQALLLILRDIEEASRGAGA